MSGIGPLMNLLRELEGMEAAESLFKGQRVIDWAEVMSDENGSR